MTELASTPAVTSQPAARRRPTWLGWLGWLPVVAIVVFVVVFRPTYLGGSTTYTFVTGSSMEPTMHTGDLAILLPADEYEIGDIVAYSPSQAPLGLIIHRIVGGNDIGGFVLRGDNRATDDVDRPHTPDFRGKAVFWIPGIGWLLEAFRQPWVVGGIFALIAMLAAWKWLPWMQDEPKGPTA